MAWAKLIRSGSNAELSNLFVSNAVTSSFFSGNGANITGVVSSSYALSASYAPSSPTVSASYAATASYVSTAIVNGGNTGAVVVGTNDATTLSFETNNITRQVFTGGASTGGALTHTDVTANTSTVETNVTRIVNSSGTPAAGFGQRQLLQLESTTTNAQDAVAMDAVWSTATHASRTADIVFNNVNNAASLAETLRIAGNGALTATNTTTTTTTAPDVLTIRINSTGTPTFNFGSSILFQGESSTTNNRDMVRLSSKWFYATDSGREAYLGISVGKSNALAEYFTFQRGSDSFGELVIGEISSANYATYFARGITAHTSEFTVTGTIKVVGQIAALKFALTDAATIAINWNNSNMQSVTLGGNRTFTFANPKSGSTYTLLIKQDATGTRTVTWPTVIWAGGSAPTLTVTANKTDIITIFYDGTSYYGSATLNY